MNVLSFRGKIIIQYGRMKNYAEEDFFLKWFILAFKVDQ